MEKYNHKEIEKKWQERWEKEGTFRAEEDSSKPKAYILDMFPYPSGDGLHVGHVEGYTATDIYSRYKRLRGFNVLHPMGWDAFGLPAENYAIKTGVPPQETTDKSIENFRKQIKALGLSYDWSREVGTHNPDYYRWTQWLFAKFFEKGLVYKKKALVNWDPVDQTVLANEQVLPDGTAERSGAKVEKRDLEQWFFKITDYADELADSLEEVDWPESTKINQRNWIGRSEGAELEFDISTSDKKIKVFTTRPDTLFGATYLVLAPEHPLVNELAEKIQNIDEVFVYATAAKNKSDIERGADGKEKTGVELKGIKAINPANKEEIPVWIADYVLGHYGTGAIMAVPAHDERDYEFAKKFGLPIRQVIAPYFTSGPDHKDHVRPEKKTVKRKTAFAFLWDKKNDRYLCLDWEKFGWHSGIIGGVDENEDFKDAAMREIREETCYTNIRYLRDIGGEQHNHFFAAHKDENRYAMGKGMIFELVDETKAPVSEEDTKNHKTVWVEADKIEGWLNLASFVYMWKVLKSGSDCYTGPGVLINSGEFSGLTSEEAKKKITEAIGGELKKTYRLRDWLISRQRYWGAPIPIVYDPQGVAHAVSEEHLPWMLPTDVEFKPTGTSPLGQSKEFAERTERIFGKGWTPEVDTMDTFVCSSWYFFRFVDPKNYKEFASHTEMQKWLPVDLYVGGAEHTVLHLLYARFFTKALRDMGYIAFGEPFLKLRHQGIILAEDSRKMSKRWGNVINPDDMTAKFGADALRMYEMFMGPLEAMKPWATRNIAGTERFLERVWKLQGSTLDQGSTRLNLVTLINQTIKKVGDDIESLKMNTAVSALMILLNELEKSPSREAYKIFLQLLAPFAPHIACELAEKQNINLAEWPVYDKSKLIAETIKIAVQVNGKVRGTIELPIDAPEEEAVRLARAAAGKWLTATEKKVIYIPGKIINFAG